MFLNLLQHWQRQRAREDRDPPGPEPPEARLREQEGPPPEAPGQPARDG